MECICTTSVSFHVNGSPTKEFQMERGLRQRGPLSPFPFFDSGWRFRHNDAWSVGTKGVSQLYHLSFDDNKVLKIINWILLKVYSSVQDH